MPKHKTPRKELHRRIAELEAALGRAPGAAVAVADDDQDDDADEAADLVWEDLVADALDHLHADVAAIRAHLGIPDERCAPSPLPPR